MTAFHIQGVACHRCGSPHLVIGQPGTDPVTNEVVGLVLRAELSRAWCSLECWRADNGGKA
jgi:hypothetical protein